MAPRIGDQMTEDELQRLAGRVATEALDLMVASIDRALGADNDDKVACFGLALAAILVGVSKVDKQVAIEAARVVRDFATSQGWPGFEAI